MAHYELQLWYIVRTLKAPVTLVARMEDRQISNYPLTKLLVLNGRESLLHRFPKKTTELLAHPSKSLKKQ